MSLRGQNVLITGASMGIGASIAKSLAQHLHANLILLARSSSKLAALSSEIHSLLGNAAETIKIFCTAVDISDYAAVRTAISNVVKEAGPISVLVNNAGLALGAPSAFPDLKIEDVATMVGTNISGMLYVTHAVLNEGGMRAAGRGTILNITSVTGLEVPPFPGEAVYHTSKAAQEAFTNALRVELSGTDIRVLALRPGVVATHFHEQRVQYDSGAYEEFMKGFEPLLAEDVADAAVWMLGRKEAVSVKALDVVPTAQRTLQVFDRGWNERRKVADEKMEK